MPIIGDSPGISKFDPKILTSAICPEQESPRASHDFLN
jgi:hypothetical protein